MNQKCDIKHSDQKCDIKQWPKCLALKVAKSMK